MKYVCFGYLDVKRWETLSPDEQMAKMDACFAYDEELRNKGHFVGGEALSSPRNAATLRIQGGKVAITDGPFVETKEILGGLLFLEARDLNEAIQLMSKHPGTQMGPWEIRPTEDLAPVIRECEKRRKKAAGQ